MKFLAWNCCGLNANNSPTIPYLRWLVSQHHPSFLFLQEIKCSFQYVGSLLQYTSPKFSGGVDSQNSSGGLAVFCWGPFDVQVISKTSNFVFCKIVMTSNGKHWHILFLYGASQFQHRSELWHTLYLLLHQYDRYLIIGNINQLDCYADKLGGHLSFEVGRT